jgi:hypothetical protein
MNTLTTPEKKEFEPSFPGENWFFYWKTAASLWESKIALLANGAPIIIPLNWGFHMDYQHSLDFGDNKPETDLKRLVGLIQKLGKQVIFLLPVSPCPFLPNGGIPSFLARIPAIDDSGVITATIDNEDKINRMYSFFDPRVFQGYRKFVGLLGSYLKDQKIGVNVYCAHLGYLLDEKFHYYIQDNSNAFDQGFNRYLEQNQLPLFQNLTEELNAKENYSDQVRTLYEFSAKEALGNYYAGTVKVSFIGGEPVNLIERSYLDSLFLERNISDVLHSITHDVVPSTSLLGKREKTDLIDRAFKRILSDSFIRNKFSSQIINEDHDLQFLPLSFFDIYKLDSKFIDRDFLYSIGLIPFLKRNFEWTYNIHQELPEEVPESKHPQLSFFFGKYLSKDAFNFILKLFLSGEKVFLDMAEIQPEFIKKIDLFISENKLQTEKVNFIIPMTKISLANGSLILFNREDLMKESLAKRISFFETIIAFFQISHLKVNGDEGLIQHWECRNSSTFELQYQEIRRLTLMNTSSYRKNVNLHSTKHFAFLKIIDQNLSQVKSNPLGIEVELKPNGSVSLDFGYFE